MRICTIDGIAHYARWLIRVKLGNRHHPFDFDESGILCFTEKELERAEAYLKDQGISYKIDELPAPPGFEKTVGVKYASRSEAIRHIQDNVEPESLVIPQLQARLRAAEDKAEAAEARALTAEIKAAKIDQLEARLQFLEKAKIEDKEAGR